MTSNSTGQTAGTLQDEERPAVNSAAGNLLRRPLFLCGCFLAWCFAIAAGWLSIECYANRAGDLTEPPSRWPAESQLPRPAGHARLLLFAHPRCPCTRATLAELDRFLTRNRENVDTCVVFTKPADVPDGWEGSDLLRKAQSLEGVSTIVDTGGIETKRFRAHTSGVAMLYNREGRLLFYGGLTASRGHEGDSAGMAALQAILDGQCPSIAHTDVFGCPLETPGTETCTGDGKCRTQP
jgi:hypothetical protein